MSAGRIYKILISFLILSYFSIFPGTADGDKENKSDTISIEHISQLCGLYSTNKEIPIELEKEILISLSHYPELKNVRIKFCYSKIFTSMKAVPTFGFMFKKRENRTYRIVMNSKTCNGLNLMQRTSSYALTGVLGHEIGHINDYSKLSNFKLFKLLFSYISKKGRIATENRVDKIAVEHNLGKELLEFSEYIYQDQCVSPRYLRYKKKYYNSTSELSNTLINKEKATSL